MCVWRGGGGGVETISQVCMCNVCLVKLALSEFILMSKHVCIAPEEAFMDTMCGSLHV